MKKYIFLLAGISIFAFGVSSAHAQFVAGDRVQTTATLNVRSFPSTASGTVLGTQPVGALGSIVSGPASGSGYTWWNVNYDNPPDGWSVGDYLMKVSTSTGSNCADVNKDGSPDVFDLNLIIGVAFSGATTTYVTDVNGSGATDVFDVNEEIDYLFSGGPEPTGCVTVVNMPPVINSFTGPSALDLYSPGTWSFRLNDPEGYPVSYSINFGDTTTSTTGVATTSAATIYQSHTYSISGTYSVVLTAIDRGGLTVSKTLPVTVAATSTNQEPIMQSFTGPSVIVEDQSGTWSAMATDANNDTLSYNFM